MQLLCLPVETKDAQVSYQILRMSFATRPRHLLRTLLQNVVQLAAEVQQALSEWTLASIIAGPNFIPKDLTLPWQVQPTPTLERRQHAPSSDVIRLVRLPIH